MKIRNKQNRNIKKYMLLTLMLGGINVFGMNYTQELNNLNKSQDNQNLNPQDVFISELKLNLKKIITILSEMMERPSYINTNYNIKKNFKNLLQNVKDDQFFVENEEEQNKNQFIIDHIKEILSEEFLDKIYNGEDFPKIHNEDFMSYYIYLIDKISKIYFSTLSHTKEKLFQEEKKIAKLKSNLTEDEYFSLKLEITLLEELFTTFDKCYINCYIKIFNQDQTHLQIQCDEKLDLFVKIAKEKKIEKFKTIIEKLEEERIQKKEREEIKNQEIRKSNERRNKNNKTNFLKHYYK